MMPRILTFFSVLISFYGFAQQTTFEKSTGNETATYEDVIAFYQELASKSPYVKVLTMDTTDAGLPLHLVLVDASKTFDPEAARKSGQTIFLINNGIHPGEPDGISASQMLARDLVSDKEGLALLKKTFLAIIPVYNIGGALNRNSHTRANQNGPEAYGFRGNARNYDLNRDFIKADTKNAWAFQEIYHYLQPDVFIDTHVSNGADYQYAITHLATQQDKLGGEMGTYIFETFTPKLEELLLEKQSEITPYVNVFNKTPDAEGITQFMDYPRYSTGYAALFNTLAFMIETHMLKPYDVRVKATYDFLLSTMEICKTDGKTIQRLHKQKTPSAGSSYFLDWEVDTSNPETFAFKGYEGLYKPSEVSGQPRLYYDRNKPFTRDIPYYCHFNGKNPVTVPAAYVVPQSQHEVISRLKANKLTFKQVTQDTVVEVEVYHIANYETMKNAYEGHYRHYNTELSSSIEKVNLRKGDYIFSTNQSGAKYLIETLEPQGQDSFFSWNFFDPILQQKEHFSPYVFEDVATEILANDVELKSAFDLKKAEDQEFAKSSYAQLAYIFKNSDYYEAAHLKYPIYRIVD